MHRLPNITSLPSLPGLRSKPPQTQTPHTTLSRRVPPDRPSVSRSWYHYYPGCGEGVCPQGEGGGVLAPSFGTHCEKDPESGGGDSRDRRAVTAPYLSILEWWDISKGACFNILAFETGYEGINIIVIRM